MGDVVIQKLSELQAVDEGTHWFCPRTSTNDGSFFDEDVLSILPSESKSDETIRKDKIREAEKRRDVVMEASKIFAFEGSDAKPYQDRFTEGLKSQLTRCDVCVRQYHRARSLLMQNLEQEFESDEVRQFMEKFDAMNNVRIETGLHNMTENLHDLPPDRRNIASAGDVGMYALFEALNCVPFLNDREALEQHFDRPFRLVQTNKKLKLPNYAPGMTAFLFSHSQERSAWAFRNFGQVKRNLTAAEFQYSVKPFWEAAMGRVNITCVEAGFLPIFWKASRLIISKLTPDLVANHLRNMDTNLYTLAIEHFQIDSPHFNDLLSSYQALLELNAEAFWDAFGSISPQAVSETIMRSPVLDQMMKTTQEKEPLQLEDKLQFTVQFIKTIKPKNLVPPARFILDMLLHKLQTDTYSRYARNTSWEKGMACMLHALKMMTSSIGGGPIAAHMLQVIAADHISLVMQELDGIEKKTEMSIESLDQTCLEIVQTALALDISGLAHDRYEILKTRTLDHEIGTSGVSVWKKSMAILKPGHAALPTSILTGISGLLQLEKFSARQVQGSPKPAKDWNDALSRVLSYVSGELLERLDTFSPDQLVELLQESNATFGLISLLFNGEASVHNAALNILKVLSGEDSRRDSLMHVVRVFTSFTFVAINRALNIITAKRVFSACLVALKLCRDVFSCLCDSQDGLLRSRNLSEVDAKLMERYWERTWQLLGMIFEQMEPWSTHLGHDKQLMQDFCRETMDFANYAFDQYAIMASSLHGKSQRSGSDLRKELLEHPKTKFSFISKWLRLRDDYLVSNAVALACKLLGRLQEVGVLVEDDAAQYIEDIVTSTERDAKIKTKLSAAQKAELQRALELHLGENLTDDTETESRAGSKTQSTLQQWASSGRSSGASTPRSAATQLKQGAIDVDAWSEAAKRSKRDHYDADAELKTLLGSMDAAERYKAKMQQKQQQNQRLTKPAVTRVVPKPQIEQKSFLAKRQKEKEEADKRRAMALAKAKGVSLESVMGGLDNEEAPKGQSVMVSSDDDSDEDDDDIDADLFGSSNKQALKIQRPNVDPNGAVGLKPEQKNGPTRIQRAARSFKDMRARLAPDLTSLHKTLLKWNFFHEGDYPPGANEYQFRKVGDSFSDPITYQQTFQPLLTLEAWQGVVKSREENANKPYEVKIQNRSNVDSFIEISSIISHAENREISLSEGDLILLSQAKKPANDASEPNCLARVYRVKRQKAHCEVVYQVMSSTSLASSLVQQAIVTGLKIQSLIPLEREYGALQGLQYYDLCTQITKAKPSKRMEFSDRQIAAYQDVWNVNRAQSEAINAAMENEGFSLIQGPPGSGKTKTIVAIVGGLLSAALTASTNVTKISMPKAHGNVNGGGDAAARKLLVCAPSNAAVDELVMRLKEGITTKSGRRHNINIVRIGRSDAINTQVLDVTMEELVSRRLGNNDNDQKLRERNTELFKEHEKVSTSLREMYKQRDSGSVTGNELTDLENSIVSVRKRKNELGVRIDNAKDAERNAGREAELTRKKAQQAILDEAHVICATLSGSGHDMFQSLNIEFETVIIDEAAQCVEMSSLIPLKYGCVKCIMVGDPKQLPPTVFSREAARFAYEQSLFVRMQNNFPKEVHLLDTQYRMHPNISIFPSRAFYDGLLKDGPGMTALRQRPWHASTLLAPYRFFDVAGQHQSAPKGHSLINLAEIDIAMALYERLTKDFHDYEYTGRIGVITPYKSQLRALKEKFSARFGHSIFDTIEFNTTDAFQGRESEIIIFSCVRASPAGGIGFLQDIRRMNVGLTRAKSSLWVLGNSDSLSRGEWWKKLVDDARAREAYLGGNLAAMLKKPSSAFPSMKGNYEKKDTSSQASQVSRENGGKRPDAAPRPRDAAAKAVQPTDFNPSVPVAASTSAHDVDRMEGVRYRFEDRLIGRQQDISQSKTAERPTVADTHLAPEETEDIEMASGDEKSRRDSTSARPDVIYTTPAPSLPSTNGIRKPLHVNPVPIPRSAKRPAPNPFMPRKQQRPR